MGTHRINYAASRSARERRAAPRGCRRVSFLPRTDVGSAGTLEAHADTQSRVETGPRAQDAGSEFPGSRLLGGGAGWEEALQDQESVRRTRRLFGYGGPQ